MLNESNMEQMPPASPEVRVDPRAHTLRLPQHVVYRAFPVETVVLNLQTGTYHGVNPTGGRMLELLDELGSVRESAARLAAEYGEPTAKIEQDLCDFASDLIDRGLIEIADAAQP